MKRLFYYSGMAILLAALVWSCKSKSAQTGQIETVKANGKNIPVIRLDQAPDSATTIKLTDFFEDFKIIPLETNKECLIQNTQLCFTDHSILVCTQAEGAGGPCRVLEFDRNGKYIKEFGRGGKGPGEHVGYVATELSWDPENREVFMSFMGYGAENMLFSADGKFLSQITNPIELAEGIKRFNRTLWMTAGNMAGNPALRRDSLRLILYTADGTEVKAWPRTVYPPTGRSGYTPTGWGESLYKYQDQWQLYSPGCDTLYRISPEQLEPVAVFNRGPKGDAYNSFVDPSQVIDKYSVKIINETKRHWYFLKAVTTKAEIHEFRPGYWGGMFNSNDFLIVIDKKTGAVQNIRFEDNYLGILPALNSARIVEWSESGQPFIVLQSVDFKEKCAAALKKGDLDSKIRARLEELDKQIDENSNPVVIMMNVKEA